MSTSKADSYLNAPLYQEAIRNCQIGEWETALAQLHQLVESYPLDHELRALRQEMQVRAKIDEDEVEDRRRETIIFVLTQLARVLVVVVVIGGIYWGVRTYSSWFQQEWSDAREQLEQEVVDLELSTKLRNAQNLLAAGMPNEAQVLLGEIQEANPNYPELETYIAQAESMAILETQYTQAMQLLAGGNYLEAQPILVEIAEQDPFYKDVAIQLDNLERRFMLEDLFAQGESAFLEGRWKDAVDAYESLRSTDPGYMRDDVEEHLFRSYVYAAEEALISADDSLEALLASEEYFRKALSLRPQDEEVLTLWADSQEVIENGLVASYLEATQAAIAEGSIESIQTAVGYLTEALVYRPDSEELQLQLDVAQRYLDALDNFAKGLWSDVITDLEFVYAENMDYANGTAQQALYDAYIARGKEGLISIAYEEALSDFQRAAIIAQQSPGANQLLFEAQLKVAYTLGLLRLYEDAVLVYQTALELGGIGKRAVDSNPDMASALANADFIAARGDFKNAYVSYREALRGSDDVYDLVYHMIQEGEYLAELARRYNSTVQAILQANHIINPNDIAVGQLLIIPTLP